MALPGSGQISFKDIVDEKKGNTDTVQNVSLTGLSQDGVDSPFIPNYDYETTGGQGIDVDNNTASGSNPPNQSPPFQMSEFYDYDHDFDPRSFNGSGVGSSTFNLSTSLVPCSNHPNFDMDINGSSSGLSWIMVHQPQHQPSSSGQVNSTATVRIGRDITNNRILMLLLKDGDHNTIAGNGTDGMYRILPYVGLGSATWSFKFEYDTTSSNYNSSTGNPKVFFGSNQGPGTLTTSTSYHSAPSSPGTFVSMPSFTGMAENGESLFAEGTSTALTWTAKVPSAVNTGGASLGRTSFYTQSMPVRLVIKAVDGSDTYTATSSYWSLGLSATKGIIL